MKQHAHNDAQQIQFSHSHNQSVPYEEEKTPQIEKTKTIPLPDNPNDVDPLTGAQNSQPDPSCIDKYPALHSCTSRTKRVLHYDEEGATKLLFILWASRIIPIGAAIIAVVYIIYLLATPSNWSTDADSPPEDILNRESNRGVLVSVLIAGLLNCIGAFMFWKKVRESLVVTNYGFILGPVIGFLLDQGIGTDAGFKNFFSITGFKYTFASLIGGNFMRYIVTVFLDLFISNPLQDVLKTQVAKIGVMRVLKREWRVSDQLNNNIHKITNISEDQQKQLDSMDLIKKHRVVFAYDTFVAMNYPSILQSIVAFVTFNAYTNQTRFAWAYPSSALIRAYRIPPGTIMLSTAIAGILYLNFYTIMDYISERDYFDVNTKLIYVLCILGLLYGLNGTDSIEAPIDGEFDKVWTEFLGNSKPLLGFLLFIAFVLYGFVYPLYTRMGCCGKCKPKGAEEEHFDHVAEVDHVENAGMDREVAALIEEQIKIRLNEIEERLSQN